MRYTQTHTMYKLKNYLSHTRIKAELAVLTQDNDSLDSLHKLATIYVLQREYELCLETLDRIADIHGPTSHLLLSKSMCLYRLGEINNAISSLHESLELDSDNQDSIKLLEKLQDRLRRLRYYTMGVYS